jgi:hypothetical protein
MSGGPSDLSVDFFAEPFLADGDVDWDAARDWVSAIHAALSEALGTDAWTDAHAGWFGRFAHDALRYQGVSLAGATPDDLDDLLFTLQPAQRDSAPGPADVGFEALLHFFRRGAEVDGSVDARAALSHLEDGDRQALFVAAMTAEGLTRKQKRSLLQEGPAMSGRSKSKMPRRKKGKKKRR